MKHEGQAWFVRRPRTAEDLRRPHPIEQVRDYHVDETVDLSLIDYENFTTDLLADRAFLDGKDGLCLLVRWRDRGVLVLPEEGFVGWAALPED